MFGQVFKPQVIGLRIGNVGPRPLDVRRLSIWISPEDIVQLIGIGFQRGAIT